MEGRKDLRLTWADCERAVLTSSTWALKRPTFAPGQEGRQAGKQEGRQEGRKEEQEGRKEGRHTFGRGAPVPGTPRYIGGSDS